MNTSLLGLVIAKLLRKRFIGGYFLLIVFLFGCSYLFVNPQYVEAPSVSSQNQLNAEPTLVVQTTGQFSTLNLLDVISAVSSRDSEKIVGLHVPGVFTLPVVQQPEGRPGFVSTASNTLTQFRLASEYGSMGFLAHNTLAGSDFYELQLGQEVRIIMGDGGSQSYAVGEILLFQALDPNSPYSDFRPVDRRGEDLSSTDLFNLIYAVPDRVVLQTCKEYNGDPNWGRYFVIAYPIIGRISLFDLFSF